MIKWLKHEWEDLRPIGIIMIGLFIFLFWMQVIRWVLR